VSGSNENGLVCLLSLHYVIWNNILGKLQIAQKSSKCKRGQLELSQEARIEILAEI
jgi:hypothetical protein